MVFIGYNSNCLFEVDVICDKFELECNNLNGEELMCYTELVTPPVDKYALI